MSSRNIKQMKNKPAIGGGLQNISPKTMVMIVLLSVMGILWGRVLLRGKDGPASANASQIPASQQSIQDAQTAHLQIEAVSLPQLPGRNDTLSADFFSADNWEAFDGKNSGVKVNSSEDGPKGAHRLKLEKIEKRLVLEAVIQDAEGNPSQAFVDGKILSVGQTLTVKEGPDQYLLTLENISQKKVLFTWNEITVALEMAETFEL